MELRPLRGRYYLARLQVSYPLGGLDKLDHSKYAVARSRGPSLVAVEPESDPEVVCLKCLGNSLS